jgi:hypothetical protein
MTQMFAELLILIPSTLFSGYVMFVTTVLQMVMNALDEATFRRFVLLLVKKHQSQCMFTFHRARHWLP